MKMCQLDRPAWPGTRHWWRRPSQPPGASNDRYFSWSRRGCRGCCDMTDLLHSIQGPTQMAAVALCQSLASHQQGPIMFNMFNMFNTFNIPPDLLLVSPWKSCRVMPVTYAEHVQNLCTTRGFRDYLPVFSWAN